MRNPDFSPSCCQPLQPGGFLMQQIVGAGRVFLRYQRFQLPLDALPCDVRRPVQLTAVSARESGISAQRCDDPCGRGLSMQVCIPLCCAVRDACGACFTAESSIQVQVPMRLCDPCAADRAIPQASAQVRLARPCGCGDVPEAWLDVCVQVWLTACRPMYGGACPPCPPPPLPLYPQPCRPR